MKKKLVRVVLAVSLGAHIGVASARYVQPDPIGHAGGSNRYGYANGNTLRYTDPDGLIPLILIPIIAAAIGSIAGGGGNYLAQKYWQRKCEVDGFEVANAAAWGALGGAAMPLSGGTLVGAAGVGATANVGQYFTGQMYQGGGITGSGVAWNAATGAVGGAVGGAFARPVTYGATGTALPQMARDSQTMATLGANTGVGAFGRNALGGTTGNVPLELPGIGDCTCRR